MSLISIFSGVYCSESSVIEQIQKNANLTHINDKQVIGLASELSGISEDKLSLAFSSKTSVFNSFTHEKECSVAYLRLAVSRMLEQKNIIFSGYCCFLLPRTIRQMLRICLTAQDDYRNKVAADQTDLTEQQITDLIKIDDQNKKAWTKLLYTMENPWTPDLYDLVIPIDEIGMQETCNLIEEKILKIADMTPLNDADLIEDFALAAQAEVAFANAGHNVGVTVHQKKLTLNINHQVLMLNRLEEELKSIAQKFPNIISTQIQVGQADKSHLYRKHNAELPSKVLLVDDEKEFVQTLSERLQMREMGSVVAYDGPSALELVKNDDPEVMIIDLKMPGMDGMEILEKVKQTRPEIEVIVLTGHGSEQDRQKCMDLGAFAYMQKPVDINLLSESLNLAHTKIKTRQ